jgi:hypothetical protein
MQPDIHVVDVDDELAGNPLPAHSTVRSRQHQRRRSPQARRKLRLFDVDQLIISFKND